MLANLEQIDWSSLTHAYGSAADVPALIRGRASTDPEKASEAESEMFGNIWHQGTVYEATSFAVPFLVELLGRRETHDRAGLVMLLASIAKGSSYLEVHGDLPYYQQQDQSALQEKLEKELKWKSRAREAVQQFAPVYWRLLDDSSLLVCLPYLLAGLPAEMERVHERIPQLLHTALEPAQVASLLLCLAVTSKNVSNPFATFSRFLCEVDPLMRLSAALGILISGTEDSNQEQSLEIYFHALRDPDEIKSGDNTWLWGEGDIWNFLLSVHSLFSESAKVQFARLLPERLLALDSYTAACLAADSMHLGFDSADLPKRRSDLNNFQLALLGALARDTRVSYNDPPINSIQQALGLSRDIKDLRKFLEGSPPATVIGNESQ
jgi:hypothetical protein